MASLASLALGSARHPPLTDGSIFHRHVPSGSAFGFALARAHLKVSHVANYNLARKLSKIATIHN